MLTNASCTIYHKTYNPQTRHDDWVPTQYPACSWYGKRGVSTLASGLTAASVYLVRIPTQEEIPVDTGDVVVHGLVEDIVTGPAPLFDKYEAFTAQAVRDNRRGSSWMQHWRIEGE